MIDAETLAIEVTKCMEDNLVIALNNAEKLNRELYETNNQLTEQQYLELENNATNAFNEVKGMEKIIFETNKIITKYFPTMNRGGRKTKRRRNKKIRKTRKTTSKN